MPVDFDRLGAVNDNRPDLAMRASQGGKKSKKEGYVVPKGQAVPSGPSQVPQATGMPGQAMIIADAGRGKGDRKPGIPGILTTTTLGSQQRTRLVSGIIDLSERKPEESGPLHSVSGHDATAMNAGMRPIPGAVIR